MEVSTTTNILNAGFRRNSTTASDLLNTDTFGIGNALRITSINSPRNNALNSGIENENLPNPPVNAFGIGSANQPEVELSPQARILQQNDSNQRELAEGLQQVRDAIREGREEQATSSRLQSPSESSETARLRTETATLETEVSAPEVQTARPSLQAQRATSLYNSVQSFT